MSKKRNLDSFFLPISQKKVRRNAKSTNSEQQSSHAHPSYPYPVPHFPAHISDKLTEVPASHGKEINHETDLDLLYFHPYIPQSVERDLFEIIRRELFYYRVQYKIKRGPIETQIKTPRFTTVFGVDASSAFTSNGILVNSQSSQPVASDKYKTCTPRPIPHCLDYLRQLIEISTNATYNFCLVNYYANGADSISYHSDDERFLGLNPSIASLSLGSTRDFLMKHKPISGKLVENPPANRNKAPLKLSLASGDMILMRGTTQAHWLHSIPKKNGHGMKGGRINITFRNGKEKYSTQNYYQYNVGEGSPWKWNDDKGEMLELVKRKED